MSQGSMVVRRQGCSQVKFKRGDYSNLYCIIGKGGLLSWWRQVDVVVQCSILVSQYLVGPWYVYFLFPSSTCSPSLLGVVPVAQYRCSSPSQQQQQTVHPSILVVVGVVVVGVVVVGVVVVVFTFQYVYYYYYVVLTTLAVQQLYVLLLLVQQLCLLEHRMQYKTQPPFKTSPL